ncbi:PREDICTED: cyclic nucleotide-gated ion channel 1-like [Ipomoea nil]|uniref:cyclic nucleotide-gated ion channel 1-like n=1 Tax=Ipomoea nil TaxID=35883 RepID=UPI000900D68B|nr:PREDICTED: cyclic nucleotide-gated ion channel 1-like [Ipomoea nil]
MNLKQEKYVRFEKWRSEKSSPSSSYGGSEGQSSLSNNGRLFRVMSSIRRAFEKGSQRICCTLRRIHPHRDLDRQEANINHSSSSSSSSSTTTCSRWWKSKMHDPQGPFLQRWNRIFVIACILAATVDPLFFYIPVVDDQNKCLGLDRTLEITACILRSVFDFFYIFHIILQFRTGFVPPSSRVFGRGDLIVDPSAIAKRYFFSYFFIDILAVLPLPQVVLFMMIPRADRPFIMVAKDILKVVILVQSVPRLLRIYPLYKEVTRTSGFFTETAWAGAAFNLFLYMIASYVAGAIWYITAIERQDKCWRRACEKHGSCDIDFLYCTKLGRRGGDFSSSFLNTSCALLEPENLKADDFDFGIFLDALKSNVVEKRYFWSKLFYCFWWGLRNLSSLGQNLKTSNFVGEILFAILISIIGLILFSLLIGNMQKYLQSITVRVEEMRVKRMDAEQWMSHRMLPDNLRERIRRYEQYRWQETRGVDEESLISNLPKDLRRDINRHLCWSLLKRVHMFKTMDEQLLDAICDRLKPVLYTEKSCIVREGDPVDEMIFVMRGNLLTMTTNGGRTGFLNSDVLNAGDFCGEELLTWALDPNSSSSLPISTRTVQALTDVEAFALTADFLKFFASQYRRLHSKQLQHKFRFYSHQWKTWAACFIQAAWRRHCRNKLEKSLREEEDRLQDALILRMRREEGETTPSLGATIYASRFAANVLRTVRRNHPLSVPKLSPRLPPLLLQKPAEPDFSAPENNNAS